MELTFTLNEENNFYTPSRQIRNAKIIGISKIEPSDFLKPDEILEIKIENSDTLCRIKNGKFEGTTEYTTRYTAFIAIDKKYIIRKESVDADMIRSITLLLEEEPPQPEMTINGGPASTLLNARNEYNNENNSSCKLL